jgi:peptidoglycan/LPS O-acetylase OafA/YrhL
MGTGHIAPADGIRGFACLIVLVVHAAAFSFPATFPYLEGCGKVGVWLFFALSAYLLTHQLKTRGLSRDTLLDYFVGRVLRIYPLFALAVVGYYFLQPVGIASWGDVWLALTFQKGYAHLWTIPVEFKFYALLPVIVAAGLYVQSRMGDRGLLLVAALATLAHQLFYPYWGAKVGGIDTMPYLPAFLFGSIVALLPARKGSGDAVGLAILAGVFLAAPFVRHALFGIEPSGYLVDKFLWFGLAWAVFIATQAHSTGMLAKLFSGAFLTRIGQYSYSIYLVHLLVVLKAAELFPQSVVAATASVAVSVIAGAALYRIAEKPIAAARRPFVDALRSAGGRQRLLDLH